MPVNKATSLKFRPPFVNKIFHASPPPTARQIFTSKKKKLAFTARPKIHKKCLF